MNAKRSSDRFFKSGLASSSLAIPARLSEVHGGRGREDRREIVALVYGGSIPSVRPYLVLFQDGVTGNTPAPDTGESRFEPLSWSQRPM